MQPGSPPSPPAAQGGNLGTVQVGNSGARPQGHGNSDTSQGHENQLAGARAVLPRKGVIPESIAFWNTSHGLLSGEMMASGKTRGFIARSSDGGKTWRIVYETHGNVTSVRVSAAKLAVATVLERGKTSQASHVIFSSDGGSHFKQIAGSKGLVDGTISTSGELWAISGTKFDSAQEVAVEAKAGAGPFRTRKSPCVNPASFLRGISVPSATSMYVLCTGQAAAGSMAKAVLFSKDGGQTFHTAVSVPIENASLNTSGILGGYPEGIEFLPDGQGWLWETRGGLYATKNGGKHFAALPGIGPGANPYSIATDVCFADLSHGLALIRNAAGGMELWSTSSGGQKWAVIRTWPRP